MKIQTSQIAKALDGTMSREQARTGVDVVAQTRSKSDRADLTLAGRMVADLRAEASQQGLVRPNIVAQMRRDILLGKLGTPEDIDRAVNRLMQEL